MHVESVRTHLFDQLTPQQVENMRDIGETLLRHLDPGLTVLDGAQAALGLGLLRHCPAGVTTGRRRPAAAATAARSPRAGR